MRKYNREAEIRFPVFLLHKGWFSHRILTIHLLTGGGKYEMIGANLRGV